MNMLCERRQSAEGKEGMNCFFNKKKPSWVLIVCLNKHVLISSCCFHLQSYL